MSSLAAITHFTPSTKFNPHLHTTPSFISFPHFSLSHFSLSPKLNPQHRRSSPNPPSQSLSLRHKPISPTFSFSHTHPRIPPISSLSGDGGVYFGGGGGGGGDKGGPGGEAENENEGEAIMMLGEIGRPLNSLPKDLADAIRAGRIPESVVSRYLELEKSGVLKWMLQFVGFRERLLADEMFLAKVVEWVSTQVPHR